MSDAYRKPAGEPTREPDPVIDAPACRGWYPRLPKRGHYGSPYCLLFGHSPEDCQSGCHTKCIFCGKPLDA